MYAAQDVKLDCLEHLIAKGAKLNAQNNDNYTALHWAVIAGRAPCVESLLKAGADASLKTNDGVRRETALDIAKRKNRKEVIKHLKNAAPASTPMVVVEGVVL